MRMIITLDPTATLRSAVAQSIREVTDPTSLMEIAKQGAEIFAQEWRVQEQPHNYTGKYQAAIKVVEGGALPGNAFAFVQTDLKPPYDFYLEYGTSRQDAQPVMRPAYDISAPKIAKFFEGELQLVLNE